MRVYVIDTHLLVPRSRSSAKFKVKYYGYFFREKKKTLQTCRRITAKIIKKKRKPLEIVYSIPTCIERPKFIGIFCFYFCFCFLFCAVYETHRRRKAQWDPSEQNRPTKKEENDWWGNHRKTKNHCFHGWSKQKIHKNGENWARVRQIANDILKCV